MENWEQLLASFNDDNDLEGSQDKLDALEKKLFHIDSITGQEELDYTKSTVHDFIPLTTPPIMITEADLEPSLPLDSALDSHVSQYDLKSELELMGEMIQEADFAQSRIQDALTIDPFLEKILLDATASLEPLEVASEILNDIIEHIPYENEISLQIQDEFREIIKRSQDHLNQDITIKDASKTQDDVIYDDDINSPITFKIDSISDVEHEDKVTIDPQTPEITLENIQESSIDLSCSVMSIPSPKKQGKKLKPAKFISHRRSASSYKKSEVSSPLPAVEVIPEQLIDISIQWEEYNSKLAELKQTEKTRENELNETLAKIKKERDAYEKCKFRLEELRSMHTAHTAELRSLKNKFRQQQERNKLAIHWFKVDAKGIFDREKEKSASLIKRTMAIIEANNTLIAKNNEKFKNSIEKSASIKSMIKTISETTSADLKTSHKQMKSESESLRNDLLLQTAEVERKRRLRSNYQAEKTMEVERVRVFDYNLLVGAFKLIYNEETVDLGKLQLVKITNLNLTELPDLNKVPNIRMLDINDNKIVNLDKLKNVNNLNYLKIDVNKN